MVATSALRLQRATAKLSGTSTRCRFVSVSVLAGGFASPSLLFPQQVDLGGIDGRSIGVLL
jgi:hypothetical protein